MNKLFFGIVLGFLFVGTSLSAQKYFTRDGYVSFYSDSPMEKIEAENNKLNCVLDLESGKIQFAALVQSFHFEKALMQEHFNENYMESGKFPKATFSGMIENQEGLDLASGSETPVMVKGQMTIHGITKDVSAEGILVKNEGNIEATSTFDIKLADYDISIPGVVKDNIAEVVQIHVKLDLAPLQK